MEKPVFRALFILLLLLSLYSPSLAEIKTLKITSDSRPLILLDKFGFSSRGTVSTAVSDVAFSSATTAPDASLLGFFLVADEQSIYALYDVQARSCVLSSPYVQTLFTFLDLSPQPSNSYNRSFPVLRASDEYSLFFANCASDTVVSMSVRTETYAQSRPKRWNEYLLAEEEEEEEEKVLTAKEPVV